MNFDGAWVKASGCGGYGSVARDFSGIFQGAGGRGDLPYESSLIVEANAIRAAVLACIDRGFAVV